MTRLRLSDRVNISEGVVHQKVGGEAVLLKLESAVYYGLGEVGARVWELLGEKGTLEDVCQALMDEYEVNRDDLERDLVHLVEELRSNGLVEVARQP